MKILLAQLALLLTLTLFINASEVALPKNEPCECKKSNKPYTAEKFVRDTAQGVVGAGFMIVSLYTALKTLENGLKVLGWSAAEGALSKVAGVGAAIKEGVQDVADQLQGKEHIPVEPTFMDNVNALTAHEMPAVRTATWGTVSVITFITGLKFLKRSLYCH